MNGKGEAKFRMRIKMANLLWRLFEEKVSLISCKEAPGADRNIGKMEPADADANQSKGGVANGSGHSSDLAVFAFNQFQFKPARRNRFTKANGRIAGRDVRLWIKKPCAALACFRALNNRPGFEFAQGFGCRNVFDLNPIFTLMRIPRVQ